MENYFKNFGRRKKTIQMIADECIGYTRISGAKQMDGLSLEVQLNGINEYAQKQKLKIQEYFGKRKRVRYFNCRII